MSNHQMRFALCAALLSCTSFSALPAAAAGFYLQEQSISGLGSAFAGQAAMPRDASIVYFNPAGMTGLESGQITLGAHILRPSSDIDNDGSTIDSNPGGGVAIVDLTGNDGGNPYGIEPIPNLHVAYPFYDKRGWVGLAISAPFGLANEYNDGWFGRYDSTKTELKTIDVAPSLAFKINRWLSVGGGLNIQYAEAELKNVVSVTTEGESKLEGDDINVGYNFGVLLQPTETTNLGVHYRSSVDHTLDGRIVVTGTGSALVNRDEGGTADLRLPDILQFAVAQKMNDRLTLLGSANWFGWNSFDNITAINDAGTVISTVHQNYQTTWAFAIGAEYALNTLWTLRAGYQFDETPTTDEYRTSRTPDGDRNWFSAGATYQFNDRLSLDMAATYIDVEEGIINVNRNIPSANANVRANTDGSVGIVAFGLNYKF